MAHSGTLRIFFSMATGPASLTCIPRCPVKLKLRIFSANSIKTARSDLFGQPVNVNRFDQALSVHSEQKGLVRREFEAVRHYPPAAFIVSLNSFCRLSVTLFIAMISCQGGASIDNLWILNLQDMFMPQKR